MYKIKVWTDGSCWNSHEDRPGGWCAIVAAIPQGKDITEEMIAEQASFAMEMSATKARSVNETTGLHVMVLKGYDNGPDNSNNRMEMTAAIEAIKALDTPCTLTITTDSEYVINMFGRNYNAKANKDLIRLWKEASEGFNVKWVHIDGHSGNPVNEVCDSVADYKRGEWYG